MHNNRNTKSKCENLTLSQAETFLLVMNRAKKNRNKQTNKIIDPNIRFTPEVVPNKYIQQKIISSTGSLLNNKLLKKIFEKNIVDNKIYAISRMFSLESINNLINSSLPKLKEAASHFRKSLPSKNENLIILPNILSYKAKKLAFHHFDINSKIAFTNLSSAYQFVERAINNKSQELACVIVELPLNPNLKVEDVVGHNIKFNLDNTDFFAKKSKTPKSQLCSIILLDNFFDENKVETLKQICACDEIRIEFGNATQCNSENIIQNKRSEFDIITKIEKSLEALSSNIDHIDHKDLFYLKEHKKAQLLIFSIHNQLDQLLKIFSGDKELDPIVYLNKITKKLDQLKSIENNGKNENEQYSFFMHKYSKNIDNIYKACEDIYNTFLLKLPQNKQRSEPTLKK